MSWNSLPPLEQEQLRRRLSDRALVAYILWLAGANPDPVKQRLLGYSKIAAYLGCDRSTAVYHVKKARAIHDEVRAELLEAA